MVIFVIVFLSLTQLIIGYLLLKVIKMVFPVSPIKLLFLKRNSHPTIVKSKDGFLMLDENAIASVDYSNPEARRKLREQIEFFSKIEIK